jgi:GNAT superfamily N-acetyltransferase
MPSLPEDYTVRPATIEDADAIAALANAYSCRFTGSDVVTGDQLCAQMTTPGFSLEEDTRLIHSTDGTLCAFGSIFDIQEPHVHVGSVGIVGANYQRRGLGTYLYEWILPRARRAIPLAPKDARVVLQQNVFENDAASDAFLRSRGFAPSRHYWRMAINLEEPAQPPVWPDGIVPEAVDVETGLEASVRAVNEAFRDHYGFVEGSFEEDLQRTRHRIASDPNYDPELNFVARDGDHIAGVCFCRPLSGTDRDAGYVGVLGVLPAWRKRGIGLALLLEAFARFRAQGKRQAHLHVDADSLTGATRLYKRAGMHVDQLTHEYTLELRPGVDLATR